MTITLKDTEQYWRQLLPLTYTRAISDIRVGIFTIVEKWQQHTQSTITIKTQDYLQNKYEPKQTAEIEVNASILPTAAIFYTITKLSPGESLYQNDTWIASNTRAGNRMKIELDGSIKVDIIDYPEKIYKLVSQEIINDLELIKKNRPGQKLSSTNTVLGDDEVYLEEGATVECSILNTTDGPIYIGKNAMIMEGSLIRGPFSLGDYGFVKMGARIYKGTSIGPYCKAGGEINNSVMFGYSNKGHEGYMGNSVIGEWCNWGADTNNSNLKNNYTEVKLWDYNTERFRGTGTQFAGLIMGDHSKCGINTMFNTGTTLGVSCNIFGTGFPRKFVPSFSWGGAFGYKTYMLDKAIEAAALVMKRRDIDFTKVDTEIFKHIFNTSNTFRKWD